MRQKKKNVITLFVFFLLIGLILIPISNAQLNIQKIEKKDKHSPVSTTPFICLFAHLKGTIHNISYKQKLLKFRYDFQANISSLEIKHMYPDGSTELVSNEQYWFTLRIPRWTHLSKFIDNGDGTYDIEGVCTNLYYINHSKEGIW